MSPVVAPPASAPRASGQGIYQATIYTGGLFASQRPAEVRTVLGSCVSACLYDPALGYGGMNHFSLPGNSDSDGFCTRFGVYAMELLVNELVKMGVDRKRILAKVFGAGQVIDASSELFDIGARNRRFVETYLVAEKIPVVASRWGGRQPLRLSFFTETGRVLVRPGAESSFRSIAKDEASYRKSVLSDHDCQDDASDVTLF